MRHRGCCYYACIAYTRVSDPSSPTFFYILSIPIVINSLIGKSSAQGATTDNDEFADEGKATGTEGVCLHDIGGGGALSGKALLPIVLLILPNGRKKRSMIYQIRYRNLNITTLLLPLYFHADWLDLVQNKI